MIEDQTQKWISDAAYFNSLNRDTKPGQDVKDWLAAEKLYFQLMKKRVKTGLVKIN
ncbi:DUF2934 domain-containing protein [Methyloprofundus sp.]|uniref:DUF2934 domain-containing protein n=1 Tax=Methyloprofundus sp. TaxID=2020875 RepID=UPI003D12B84C